MLKKKSTEGPTRIAKINVPIPKEPPSRMPIVTTVISMAQRMYPIRIFVRSSQCQHEGIARSSSKAGLDIEGSCEAKQDGGTTEHDDLRRKPVRLWDEIELQINIGPDADEEHVGYRADTRLDAHRPGSTENQQSDDDAGSTERERRLERDTVMEDGP